MKKQSLKELKKMKFEAVSKTPLNAVKGGFDRPTIERYWTHYDCPDIEMD